MVGDLEVFQSCVFFSRAYSNGELTREWLGLTGSSAFAVISQGLVQDYQRASDPVSDARPASPAHLWQAEAQGQRPLQKVSPWEWLRASPCVLLYSRCGRA